MFHPKSSLKSRKTHGVDRFRYLQLLLEELTKTDSKQYRAQILANLANFAYDPLNYAYMQQLSIPGIFIDILQNPRNLSESRFCSAGLLNLLANPAFVNSISDKIDAIVTVFISCSDDAVLCNLMTALLYIADSQFGRGLGLLNVDVIPRVGGGFRRLADHENVVISNLSKIFVKDYL